MSNTQEIIWKPVKGYEGLYEVSSYGSVKSLKYGKGQILKEKIDIHGYPRVRLSKNGKRKPIRVNRLVAIAFIPNPLGLPEVNHKDEVKSNNRVENLEWCTPKYNCNYGNRNAKISDAQRGKPRPYVADALSKAVQALNPKTLEVVYEFSSINEAQRQGFNSGHICECCNGKRKTHHGLLWRFY